MLLSIFATLTLTAAPPLTDPERVTLSSAACAPLNTAFREALTAGKKPAAATLRALARPAATPAQPWTTCAGLLARHLAEQDVQTRETEVFVKSMELELAFGNTFAGETQLKPCSLPKPVPAKLEVIKGKPYTSTKKDWAALADCGYAPSNLEQRYQYDVKVDPKAGTLVITAKGYSDDASLVTFTRRAKLENKHLEFGELEREPKAEAGLPPDEPTLRALLKQPKASSNLVGFTVDERCFDPKRMSKEMTAALPSEVLMASLGDEHLAALQVPSVEAFRRFKAWAEKYLARPDRRFLYRRTFKDGLPSGFAAFCVEYAFLGAGGNFPRVINKKDPSIDARSFRVTFSPDARAELRKAPPEAKRLLITWGGEFALTVVNIAQLNAFEGNPVTEVIAFEP